jgi:hypothetical protein
VRFTTDYTYAIYIWWAFSFGDERIGLTYCMVSYYHIASRSKPWKPKGNQSFLTWSCILRIPSTLILHGSFSRYQNSEFLPRFRRAIDSSTTLIFRIFPRSCVDYAQVLKSRSYIIRFKSEIPAAPPTCRDHNSWIVGYMKVYLYFLEGYENSLPLLYCSFLLILHQIQSARFCEIVVSPNQNLYSRFFHLCIVFQWS